MAKLLRAPVKTLALMPSKAVVPKGSKALEKRSKGATVDGQLAERTVTGREISPGKGAVVTGRKSGGNTPTIIGQGSQSEEAPPVGSASEEETRKKPKGVVRSDRVVSMLMEAGIDEQTAEDMVLSAQLSQSNPRESVAGTPSRRVGGTGYGRGSSGGGSKTAPSRRVKTAAPVRSPGSSGSKPLALPGSGTSGSKPLALPGSGSSGSKPLALPGSGSSGSKPLALPGSGSSGSKPLALVADPAPAPSKLDKLKGAVKAKVGEKVQEAANATGEGQMAQQIFAEVSKNFQTVKDLWKAGRKTEAIVESTKSAANPAHVVFKSANVALDSAKWLREQIQKL